MSGGCRRHGATPLLSLLKAPPSRDDVDQVLLEVTAVVDLASSTAAAGAPHPQDKVEEAPVMGGCRCCNSIYGRWVVAVRDGGDNGHNEATDTNAGLIEGLEEDGAVRQTRE